MKATMKSYSVWLDDSGLYWIAAPDEADRGEDRAEGSTPIEALATLLADEARGFKSHELWR